MSDIAIRAEGLSKSYQIAGQREKYSTFRDSLMKGLTAPARRARALLRGQAHGASELNETFWALQDVSFEIKHGEVIGIIGRNGAGKSTLLKILSRITEPTRGVADLYGRVGALLEVGTGFHPELTGRENLYLNGAILGMKRAEIARKFDEIVAFADIETFIDTPVKHYSSGMGLRLGFSVAAHLDPDILIVDEVLAVGDAAFQQRCLNKMNAVANDGRTVLFVTHNMSAVVNLCSRTYLLSHGRIAVEGPTADVVSQYLSVANSTDKISLEQHPGRRSTSKPFLKQVQLTSVDGTPTAQFKVDEPLRVVVEVEGTPNDIRTMSLGLMIKDHLGTTVFATNMKSYGLIYQNKTGERAQIAATFRQPFLAPGSFSISLYLGNGTYDVDVIDEAIYFDVVWSRIPEIVLPPKKAFGSVFTVVDWNFPSN
ncbi:MAG: ABC transporter ATP-binding protein [Anaerolinea sp.]|nr:ABC transporter ATP-binding protein [Anaerolinea sp.]